MVENIPKKIFIVPYRDRAEQKFFFCKYMGFILEHMTDYEIYFSHQSDLRSFNRGATKNIGFLAMKEKYPDDYQGITFIFNDLDTIPFNRIFDYNTTFGVVKHYYGFENSLGGIVVIKGGDFEIINGYPNYWSWGNEDSCLQKRCTNAEIAIDRSHFYKIGSPEILQLFDGVHRIINKKDPHRLTYDDGSNGLSTIQKLEYTIDDKSSNDKDNLYGSCSHEFGYINITQFQTETPFENDEYFNYDLREPVNKIMNPEPHKQIKNIVNMKTNSRHIPYYPTIEERQIMEKTMQSKQNKRSIVKIPQPPQLVHQFPKTNKSTINIYPTQYRSQHRVFGKPNKVQFTS